MRLKVNFVNISAERRYSSWIGGSVMGSLVLISVAGRIGGFFIRVFRVSGHLPADVDIEARVQRVREILHREEVCVGRCQGVPINLHLIIVFTVYCVSWINKVLVIVSFSLGRSLPEDTHGDMLD